MKCRRRLLLVLVLVLVLAAAACTTQRREIEYSASFCEAHPLVGVVEEVRRILALRRQELQSFGIQTGSTRARLMEQELLDYSTRWQHLHQSMTTACRDMAACRFRGSSPAAEECDALRLRLDVVTAEARKFLLDLRQGERSRSERYGG